MVCLLDSDHASLLYRKTAEGQRIEQRLRLLPPDDYGISIVTYAEATRGWLAEVAAICADLKAQKVRVGTQDLRIASIALAANATLLTRNTQDFARVPGLRFDDWTN